MLSFMTSPKRNTDKIPTCVTIHAAHVDHEHTLAHSETLHLGPILEETETELVWETLPRTR